MKKLFALILAVCLLATMSVPTFAADSQTSTITVVMKDSGGDGWAEGNFGFVSLSNDELEFEDYSGHVFPKDVTNLFTFESGTTDTITHTVAKDEVVHSTLVGIACKKQFKHTAGANKLRNIIAGIL